MRTNYWKSSLRVGAAAALAGCLWIPTAGLAWAQDTAAAPRQGARSDGDIQSQVANALAHDAALQKQQIKAYTSNGVVTLTGTVQTEQQRQEAETVAAGVPGVSGIENNLNVTDIDSQGQTAPPPATSQQEQAPPPPDAEQIPPPPDAEQAPDAGQAPVPASPQQMPPPPPPDQTTPQAQAPQQQGGYPQYPQQGYPQYPQQQGGYGQYPQQRGYPPQRGYYPPQPASAPVTIPAGTLLQVRTSAPLSLDKLQDGVAFQATAASDVFEGNVLAIPRGAMLEGAVVHVKKSGSLGGNGELQLQITSVNLSGKAYPLTTDIWTSKSPSKSGYTATNTVGGALVGALIGGLIGRGPGAAAGAIIGGVGGMGASAATHGPGQYLPAESLLNFHLAAAVTVQPVSWQEARRLAQNVPQLQRRPVYMAPPYPYPYAYPYPYPYPYRVYYYGW